MGKRILAIAATPYFADRGGHIRVYNVLKYLEKSGYSIRLATYGLGYNPPGANFPVIRNANLPWYKKLTPGASIWKPLLDLLLLGTAIKQRFQFNPEIIQPFQYEALAIAILVKYLTFSRAKLIFDCQGSVSQEIQQYNFTKPSLTKKIMLPLINFAERVLLWFPDKTLCSSINSYNFLRKEFGITDSKIMELEDGIDMDLFDGVTAEQATAKRKELGIPDNNKVIIYTGSLNKAKGVDLLLNELPAILPEMANVTFVFLGYGDIQAEYETKLAAFIATKQVIFLGKVNYFELPVYLKMADFGIDPKNGSSESSGKLYNYLASNLPVICFNSKLNMDVLGKNGLYFTNYADLPELTAQATTTTYADLSRFSWNNIVSQYAV